MIKEQIGFGCFSQEIDPSRSRPNEKWDDQKLSLRRIGMVALAFLFLTLSVICISVSFLPPTTLLFNGAYFIIGKFLAFVSLGILMINLLLEAKWILPPYNLKRKNFFFLSH